MFTRMQNNIAIISVFTLKIVIVLLYIIKKRFHHMNVKAYPSYTCNNQQERSSCIHETYLPTTCCMHETEKNYE